MIAAGGRVGRFDTGRPTNHGWEEQGVQRAPRIQLVAINVEPVRSGTRPSWSHSVSFQPAPARWTRSVGSHAAAASSAMVTGLTLNLVRQFRHIFVVFDSLDASNDGVVPCLGRGSARTTAAEVVFRGSLGPAWPSGRYCPLPIDGSGSGDAPRSAGKAAPGPNRMILRSLAQ